VGGVNLYFYTVLAVLSVQSATTAYLLSVQTVKGASLAKALGIGLFLLLALTHGIEAVFHAVQTVSVPRALLVIYAPAQFLIAPAFYFYIRVVSAFGRVSLNRRDAVHLVPAFCVFSLALLHLGTDFAWTDSALWLLWCAQIGGYVLASMLLIKRQMDLLPHLFSFRGGTHEQRLQRLLLITALIWLSISVQLIAEFTVGPSAETTIPFFTARSVALLAVCLTVLLPTPLLPLPAAVPLSNESLDVGKKAKYAKSAVDADAAERIASRVRLALRDEALVTNPALSLQDLSAKLGIPAHKLSQTLNGYMQTSFFDAVNAARVDIVKARVDQGSDQTFLALATEAGFNSKSTFNVAFKKATGMTPSEYRKSAALTSHAAQLFTAAAVGPEGEEGLRAFREKRKPGWVPRRG
jgi:AraC-like DNA-binding protein